MDDSNSTSARCFVFGDKEEQRCEVLVALRRILGVVSMLVCLVVIFLQWVFKRYRDLSQRLLIYLQVATLLSSAAQIASDPHFEAGSVPCDLQAAVLTYSEWSQLLWLWCFTLHLFATAIYARAEVLNAHERACHWICWFVPAVPSLCVAFFRGYGPTGSQCWSNAPLARWLSWFGPALILHVGLGVAVVFLAVLSHLRLGRFDRVYSLEIERQRVALRNAVRPMLGLPGVVLLLRTVVLVDRMQGEVWGQPCFWLSVTAVVTGSFVSTTTALFLLADCELRAKLTWTQLKAAWQIQLNRQTVTREIPVMFRGGGDQSLLEDHSAAKETTLAAVQFVEYDRVDYDKLIGGATKIQSCLDE